MAEELYPEVLVMGHGAINVATVGDSLTYGYNLTDRRVEAYPSILADLLGQGYRTENYGLSGRSLMSTTDFPYHKEENAQLSLQASPDIVVIMIGSNDTRAAYWDVVRFRREYAQMVETYLALDSQPDLVLVAPPYVPTSRFGLNNNLVKAEVGPIVAQIAQEYGLTFVDTYLLTEGHLEYYSDGLHLNAAGNQVLAQAIYEAMMA